MLTAQKTFIHNRMSERTKKKRSASRCYRVTKRQLSRMARDAQEIHSSRDEECTNSQRNSVTTSVVTFGAPPPCMASSVLHNEIPDESDLAAQDDMFYTTTTAKGSKVRMHTICHYHAAWFSSSPHARHIKGVLMESSMSYRWMDGWMHGVLRLH